MANEITHRIVLVGIGGATSSGKTMLARHLQQIIPSAPLLHQDDFAPPPDQIPVHHTYNMPDWDDPPTAIDWPAFRTAVSAFKRKGKLPAGHVSREAENQEINNTTALVPVASRVQEEWKSRLAQPGVAFALVEGFLAFWDAEIYDLYDVRFFMRSDYATIKQRREARNGYALAGYSSGQAHGHQSNGSERDFWQDPPGYFDKIVWPSYQLAHSALFRDADPERGGAANPDELHILEQGDMSAVIDEACRCIVDVLTR